MSNVLVNKDKIDLLANAISAKSGEPLTLTLDEMVEAVDGIDSGITPTGNINITQAGVTDVTNYATATVPQADPWVMLTKPEYYTTDGQRKWRICPKVEVNVQEGDVAGFIGDGYSKTAVPSNWFYAVPSGTTITPTESSQTIGGRNYMMEGAVTVNAIPSNYVGSGIARKSSTDLTVSGATVTAPAGYYSASASKSVASGTAGTPTATKGTVSNHSVSVTPSVTNTTGYITGGTKTGTAVSVSASELVSGSQTITENGTVDVTNLAEVVVDVSGGGEASDINVRTATRTLSTASNSIQFTGLSGNPTSFVVTSLDDITTNTNGVTQVVFDGTSLHGQILTTQAEADTGFTKSYSGGTLTITATTGSFRANEYKLVYTYGGSTSDIKTADVQVGSGATSVTFPVSGNPKYWSCIFKSDFSTSSGYQRVIGVANDGTNTYGLALDSSAHALTSWTASYSGGNLTITSQGTNNGGYFHQPGYYQLTYVTDSGSGGGGNYQTKTVTPTTQQQTVTPDSGYDALSEVTVNAIPNTYVQPTTTVGATTYRASTSNQTIQAGTYHSGAGTIAAVTQTNLTAANIKEGTTITISNGQSNLWSVTGTYSGGGGVNIDTKTVTASNYPTSLSFTGMLGQPKAFFLKATSQISSSGSTTYYYIINMRYNGTNTTGSVFRIGSTRQVNHITSGYSWSYSGTTLTITSNASSRSASPGAFNNGYELVYIY